MTSFKRVYIVRETKDGKEPIQRAYPTPMDAYAYVQKATGRKTVPALNGGSARLRHKDTTYEILIETID